MYPISPAFEFFLRSLDQTWRLKVDIEGVEYGPDEVVDFSIEGGLTTGDEFTLGTAISSRLTLQLRTISEIPPNAKIIPYVAMSSADLTWRDAHIPWNQANFSWDGSGGTAWLPLGVFYVDNRKKQNKVWTFECYDGLVFADIAYISELSYPASMQDVWDELCDRAGLEYDDSVQIDPSLTINAGPAGYTCRQVLGYIAGIHGASAVMSRDGKVSWKRFAADDDPVFEFSEKDYIRVKQTNPVKTYTRLVVTYDTEDQLTYEAGEGDENHTLHLVNPLMSQEMVDDLLDQINGLAYVPIEMDARGFPHMELGDVIGYEYTESMAWDEAKIPWQDAHFPWDGKLRYRTIILRQSFGFRGGLSMRIEAPSKSEQQSEFKLEGSLTQQVNRLTQSSVRYDKPYYGVTHSRDEGIVVQREDGKAKAVFNADELSFYANGTHALWFDVPNLRWKFSGTLEGVDGTFSGKIEAGEIVGGTIQGAEINGVEINGAEINGAEINGGIITGSTIQTGVPGLYPRISLDSSSVLLSAQTSPLKRFEVRVIAQDEPTLFFFDGDKGSLIWQLGDTLNITSADKIRLYGDAEVSLGGPISFNDGVPVGTLPVPLSSGTDPIDNLFNVLLTQLAAMKIIQVIP